MRDEKRNEELRHTARRLTQKKRATEANKREPSAASSRNWTKAELDAVTKAIAQRLKDVDKGGQNDG